MARSGFKMHIISLVSEDLFSILVCTEDLVLDFLYLTFYQDVYPPFPIITFFLSKFGKNCNSFLIFLSFQGSYTPKRILEI